MQWCFNDAFKWCCSQGREANSGTSCCFLRGINNPDKVKMLFGWILKMIMVRLTLTIQRRWSHWKHAVTPRQRLALNNPDWPWPGGNDNDGLVEIRILIKIWMIMMIAIYLWCLKMRKLMQQELIIPENVMLKMLYVRCIKIGVNLNAVSSCW